MADSFTSQLRLLKQTDQGNVNIWGKNYNEGVVDLSEAAIAGRSDIDVTLSNVELTLANGAPDTARPMFLRITGLPATTRTVLVPFLAKVYVVTNQTSDASDVEIIGAFGDPFVLKPAQTVFLRVTSVGIRTTPFDLNRIIEPAALPAIQVSFDINNATAGDTVVTVTFIKQGHIIHTLLPAISTTISTPDFDLVPQTTIPTEVLPFPLNAEYSMCVEDAGVRVESFLQIQANISTTWQFFASDGTAYTAAGTRETMFPMVFMQHRPETI